MRHLFILLFASFAALSFAQESRKLFGTVIGTTKMDETCTMGEPLTGGYFLRCPIPIHHLPHIHRDPSWNAISTAGLVL